MDIMTLRIILGAGAVVWLLACMLFYRIGRNAPWLAGSTVASCLFFLGVTVLASVLVRGARFLVPLWLGVLALAVLHLHAAYREPARMHTMPGTIGAAEVSKAPSSASGNSDAYI